MFTWSFAKKIFESFTILRWTDFMRPTDFVQIEKNASQAILCYIIGKEYEEKTGQTLDWKFIVESNIYGLLFKIATSDIKSTVSNEIKKQDNYLKQLSDYIINAYYDDKMLSKDAKMLLNKKNFKKYVETANRKEKIDEKHKVEYEICYIAHKFSTYREFCYIKNFNEASPDFSKVNAELQTANIRNKTTNDTLKRIFRELEIDSNLSKFYMYFEKLRPQIRWSQTSRIPQTTVLGHSMYVAVLTYFAIVELNKKSKSKCKDKVLVDNFYSALFHDLPESLTRDIISPVKREVKGLKENLARIEYDIINENMFNLIPDKEWRKDFFYLLGVKNGTFDSFCDRKFIFGKLIKFMDNIAAFMEAKLSVETGIDSHELQKGIYYTYNELLNQCFSTVTEYYEVVTPLFLNDFLASIPQYKEGV